jgi:hypothetical protein
VDGQGLAGRRGRDGAAVSWLRIDDGFTNHPKILELTDSEFRTWIRLLCHCSRVEDPSVDAATKREVAGLSAGRVARYWKIGLLDKTGDDYEVHNWPQYRKKDETNADRQRRWRARQRIQRNAESNGSNGVTEGVTGAVTSLACDQARDQARTPVPEPEPEDKASEGNEVLLKGITEARPEGLPFDKELVMAQLRSWAGDRLKPEIADHYASKLPFASLAKVLESATTARANDRPAWLVGALKKEIAEREETAA